MRLIRLAVASALLACTPLTPPVLDDAGVDGGEPGDAGDPDAWPCDGGPCPVETIIAHRTLPLTVLPVGGFIYWSEFGPDRRGIDGTINRLPRGSTCLVADAGCGAPLTPSLLANVAPQDLVTDGVEVCWIAYDYERSTIFCFNTRTGAAKPLAQSEPYPVALTLLGGELAWARLNVPASSANGAIVAKPRDGGALHTLVGGRRAVLALARGPDDTLYWSEQTADGGSELLVRAADGGVARWGAIAGQAVSIAVAQGFVYFADSERGELGRGLLDGGGRETLASGENHPFVVRVSGPRVYWLNFGSPPEGPDGTLRALRPDGGAPRTLASGLPALNCLELEGGHAWWAAEGTSAGNFEDGVIQRVQVE